MRIDPDDGRLDRYVGTHKVYHMNILFFFSFNKPSDLFSKHFNTMTHTHTHTHTHTQTHTHTHRHTHRYMYIRIVLLQK